MISIQNVAGELVEVRPHPPFHRDEIEQIEALFRGALARLRATPVICIDLRRATVLDPRGVNQVLGLMRTRSLDVRREAVLLPEHNAIVTMQFERLAREMPVEHRRSFRAEPELTEWLGEVLTPREQTRLATFLSEGRAPAHS